MESIQMKSILEDIANKNIREKVKRIRTEGKNEKKKHQHAICEANSDKCMNSGTLKNCSRQIEIKKALFTMQSQTLSITPTRYLWVKLQQQLSNNHLPGVQGIEISTRDQPNTRSGHF